MKNVAFFFCAISAHSLKKKGSKKNANDEEEDEESDDPEQLVECSQIASQEWVDSHPTIVKQKLCPSVSYWIALTTPNGAPSSARIIHRALLECSVDICANQVTTTIITTTIFTIIRLT